MPPGMTPETVARLDQELADLNTRVDALIGAGRLAHQMWGDPGMATLQITSVLAVNKVDERLLKLLIGALVMRTVAYEDGLNSALPTNGDAP
jgi:hypothetical protein